MKTQNSKNQVRACRGRRGFSLLEMMMVVVIIGILATVLIVNLGGATQKTQVKATMVKMQQIKGALAEYLGSQGGYPPADIGLMALVTIKSIERPQDLKDAWKRDYLYRFPGTSGIPDRPYDLISYGPDGQPNTTDDIDVWTMDVTSGTTNNPGQ